MGSKENNALKNKEIEEIADKEEQKASRDFLTRKSFEEILNEDEERQDLTPSEKIKDFFSDHSDSFGCLTFLIAFALLAWGSHSAYAYFQEKHHQEEVSAQQAKVDAEKMDTEFIIALKPLVPKMTKENAPRVLNAAKHLILIEHPNTSKGLDILCKKYEDLYYKHENNQQFETFLLVQLRENMMNMVDKIQSKTYPLLSMKQHTR